MNTTDDLMPFGAIMQIHPPDGDSDVETRMNGLWTAEFGSSLGIFGGGVAVLQNGRLMGGDGAYYYLGEYKLKGAELKATITVVPYLKDYESVFKTVGRDLRLDLVGTVTDEAHAVAQGSAEGLPDIKFGVKLTKRA
jgi:hypothetical protein